MKKIILVVIVLFSSFLMSTQTQEEWIDTINEKGLIIDGTKRDGQISTAPTLNTLKTFKNGKVNDILVLLVGNNNYQRASGFPELKQCVNDTILLARILNICCKVPEENIIIHNNLTVTQFRQVFLETIAGLKKNQALLFSYSGHGDINGSLVFTHGGKLKPGELKSLVNSFENDTILMLDACYSGNNEGPIDRSEDIAFKNNSVRIYSSLAHMSAKEIFYTDDYFAHIAPFYENVLNLTGPDKLEGNSYFFSFIGYFFAEYDFVNFGNVSVWDMLMYIFNKNRQYVEFLEMRSQADKSFFERYNRRLEQQPKIFPLAKKPEYKDLNHNFLYIDKYVLKKKVTPRTFGMTSSVFTGPFLSLGIFINNRGVTDLFQNKASVYASTLFAFTPPVLNGLSWGIEVGYMFSYYENAIQKHTTFLNMIPILAKIGYWYKFKKLNNFFSIGGDTGIGLSINIWDFNTVDLQVDTYIPLASTTFCFQAGFGLRLHPLKRLSISCDVRLHGLVFNDNSILLGIVFPLAISYRI